MNGKPMIKRPVNPYLKVYRPLLLIKPPSILIQKFLKQHLLYAQLSGHFFGIHHHIAQKQIIHQKVHQLQIYRLSAMYVYLSLCGCNFMGKGETEVVRGDVQLDDGIVVAFFAPIG